MNRAEYQSLIELLNTAEYQVIDTRYQDFDSNWHIIFRSKKKEYKLLWDTKEGLIEFRRKNLFGMWNMIFACSQKEWTAKDLLLYIERNPFFQKLDHKINLKYKYPALPEMLKKKLLDIKPSKNGGDLFYYPCKVKLRNLTTYDNVYLVNYNSYLKFWGIRPSVDKNKKELNLDEIADLEESPSRIPPQLVSKLYKAGESGMGYVIFIVLFKDGTSQSYSLGSGVLDFISLPHGKSSIDIIDVVPHEGSVNTALPGPEHYWCLFSDY